jgi:hypothetical protein
MATNANAFGRKIDMNARRPIDPARSRMRGADLRHQRGAGWPSVIIDNQQICPLIHGLPTAGCKRCD